MLFWSIVVVIKVITVKKVTRGFKEYASNPKKSLTAQPTVAINAYKMGMNDIIYNILVKINFSLFSSMKIL